MGWACGAYGWGEGVYRVLLGKPEWRRPLGRPRRRWVDNISMDLQEAGCGYMDWIGLAQDRHRWRTLVSAVMNLRIPWNAVNFLTRCKPVRFSRRTLHHGVSKCTRTRTCAILVLQRPCVKLVATVGHHPRWRGATAFFCTGFSRENGWKLVEASEWVCLLWGVFVLPVYRAPSQLDISLLYFIILY